MVAGRLGDVIDPRQLYTLNEDVVSKLKESHPVLIHQLDGFVDAGQAVLDGGRFTATLPCLPSEGAGDECVDGRIPVRALDGLHLCPVRTSQENDRCPVYSSGAARFGLAMAQPIRLDLGL